MRERAHGADVVGEQGGRGIRPIKAERHVHLKFVFSFSITCIYLNIYIIIINYINNIKNLIFKIIVFKLKFII